MSSVYCSGYLLLLFINLAFERSIEISFAIVLPCYEVIWGLR